MVAIKLLILIVMLTSLLCPEIVEAAAKKQRQNIKHKKPIHNGKLKAKLKQAPVNFKTSQRSGKMNYYNSHLWPTTTNYYRPPSTSSLYLRSPSATTSSMFYPTHWGNSYINPSSLMPSNTLRRTDDFSSSSSPMSTAQSSVISRPSLNTPLMSMSNSQIPTLYDMSAFTGNAGLMEHPLTTTSNQNLWSMGETIAPTPKTISNLFNSFNYNDDGGIFGGFLNQFLK